MFLEISPLAVVAFRGLGGAISFSIIAFWKGRERIDRKDWGRLFACGMCGVGINQVLFLWGLSLTAEVNASVLMTLVPVFIMLIAWALKQESLSRVRVLGLMISFSGAILLSLVGRKLQVGSQTWIGDLMIMTNTFFYAMYIVLLRPLTRRYKVITLIAWVYILGSLLSVPIGIPAIIQTPWSTISPTAWGGLIFIVLMITVFSYGLNAWAVKRMQASKVGIYIYLQPVLVSLAAPFLAAGTLTLEKGLYILLVLGGVYLVNK